MKRRSSAVPQDSRNRQRRDRVYRRHAGLAIIPLAYTAYFSVGRINFFPYRGTVGNEVLGLAGLGLAALLAGYVAVWLVVGFPSVVRGAGPDWRHTSPRGHGTLTLVTGSVGALSVIALLVQFGGVPLFAGELRLDQSGYLAGLAYGAVVAVAAGGIAEVEARQRRFVWVAIAGSALLLVGFRTLPLIALGTVAIYAWITGRLTMGPGVVVAALGLLAGLSWLAVWRFGAGPTAYFNALTAQGMPWWFTPFAPIWITPREGVSVLSTLYSVVPADVQFLHGQALLSTFLSIAPGKQEGARTIVASLVGGRPGVTITPSILGEPYIDFGVVGVGVFMLLVGVLIAWLHRWHMNALTWAPRFAYAYVIAATLVSIHSGLLDPVLFASMALLITWSFFAEDYARKQASTAAVRRTLEARTPLPVDMPVRWGSSNPLSVDTAE
jgi:Putative O-antigen polymerase